MYAGGAVCTLHMVSSQFYSLLAAVQSVTWLKPADCQTTSTCSKGNMVLVLDLSKNVEAAASTVPTHVQSLRSFRMKDSLQKGRRGWYHVVTKVCIKLNHQLWCSQKRLNPLMVPGFWVKVSPVFPVNAKSVILQQIAALAEVAWLSQAHGLMQCRCSAVHEC